jgi:signal transduction histidine kinase
VRRVETPFAWTLADRDRIKQVFVILANHALRSMPQGGRLSVTLAPARDHWYISFADSSQGLTPQQIEKVFEPFQPELEGGTGLGLAIVYQTLQAHDARISVHSAPGEGIEFSIEMKRSEPPLRLQPIMAQVVAANPNHCPAPLANVQSHDGIASFSSRDVLETPSGVKHG